ncbi:MAG: hypothetical protein LBP67_10620 [Bacteroidales bacterium]|jgi:hypothetical protein|nr:hypothetical protein [Bacteroidales bacterium]
MFTKNQIIELATIIIFLLSCLLAYFEIPGFLIIDVLLSIAAIIVLLLLTLKRKLIKTNPLLAILGFSYKMFFVLASLFLINAYPGAKIISIVFFGFNILYTVLTLIKIKDFRYAISPYVYLQTFIAIDILLIW